MPRAGGGSRGGGGHSSGGGHHVSRSSGGHRPSSGGFRSSGSRAGQGNGPFYSGSRGGYGPGPVPPRRGPGMPPPPPRPPRRYYYGGRRSGGGCLSTILAFIIVLVILIIVGANSCGGNSSPGNDTIKSTTFREKLDTKYAYVNDCIIDELGWFDNVSRTEKQLKSFWEETGVQPFIILKNYDPSLQTDQQKQKWAENYYEENFDAENIFLYVYFAEQDVDNDVGFMSYVNGYETSAVMDSEAVEIFWNYIDSYWYSDASTDELFVKTFTKTADSIMHTAKTKYDALKWTVIVIGVIGAGTLAVVFITKRNKRKQEEAEEKQRILNTSLDDLVKEKMDK